MILQEYCPIWQKAQLYHKETSRGGNGDITEETKREEKAKATVGNQNAEVLKNDKLQILFKNKDMGVIQSNAGRP